LTRTLFSTLFLVLLRAHGLAQTGQSQFPVGTVIPKVTCSADPTQTYALYLPSGFSTSRKWPIIYLFDPFARGEVAVEVVRAAAEKFGYMVAASNNSKNGPMGRSREAATAIWQDTQQRLPVDAKRRYAAGLSGGARVAASIGLGCGDCVAGVIANAAGFPTGTTPPPDMKFAYFAAVGDADFNFAEFVELRRELDAANARYRIRIFEGSHGWAPAAVWLEALNWVDIQAMASGNLPRDEARIAQTLKDTLARAQAYESNHDVLAAFREYQSAVRDFSGLADVSIAKAKLAELEKNKALKDAATPSAQMQKISTRDLDPVELAELRASISDLKSKAARPGPNMLVQRRALSDLVIQAYDSGQAAMDKKDYIAALAYFDLAAVGSSNPAFAHYQRARTYAMSSHKKDMLAELRMALSEGFHEESALDGNEFQPYRSDAEFRALATDWKNSAK
jgi:predicted esterase